MIKYVGEYQPACLFLQAVMILASIKHLIVGLLYQLLPSLEARPSALVHAFKNS